MEVLNHDIPLRLCAWEELSSWLDFDLLLSIDGLDSSFSVTIKTVKYSQHSSSYSLGVACESSRCPLLLFGEREVAAATTCESHVISNEQMMSSGKMWCSPFFHATCAFLSLMAMKMTTTTRQRIRNVTRTISKAELFPLPFCMSKSFGRPGNRRCAVSLDGLHLVLKQSPQFCEQCTVLYLCYCRARPLLLSR